MELYKFDLIIWNIVILSVLTPNKNQKVKIVSKEYKLFFDLLAKQVTYSNEVQVR